jgi:energy-coupling factor transporter transmembrane protein EcfT
VKHFYLDKYSQLDSLLHRRDPRAKIAALGLLVVFVVGTPPILFFAFALHAALIACLVVLGRIPPVFVLRRAAVVLPFAILVAVFLPFLTPGRPLIESEELAYRYPDGTAALSGVSLEVFQGETVGLIGPNGAGKSTLLLHLNGMLRGTGSVRIAGLDVNERNLAEIRSTVGLVFQDPDNQLFMPTVVEDVAFGPLHMGLAKGIVEERVAEALERVD